MSLTDVEALFDSVISAGNMDLAYSRDSAPATPIASRSSDPNRYVRVGPDDQTIYLSYDDCDLAAMELFQGLVGELKRSSVRRLIVDLRSNSGGSSVPGTWFATQLSGIPQINRPGGICVLVGPRTFSSGMMLAVDLMAKTDALFAGAPARERARAVRYR